MAFYLLPEKNKPLKKKTTKQFKSLAQLISHDNHNALVPRRWVRGWGGLDEETCPQLVQAGQFILPKVGEGWGGLDEETYPQLLQAVQFILPQVGEGWEGLDEETSPQLVQAGQFILPQVGEGVGRSR
jgi:hypothetical protein